ncbi:hypothetical protein Agabi119p4_3412 [Agaricus bisporus var. burnettii]|uniref:Uncharacterized protein n=1 Tax=Agaricus bisporus var. burnettii TaxID=192524 RepID=A0A8H7F719_AGABI|nr:hypothetical protein Agabi119p4_3412 [Agaricus bisporus var. burnettii]
MSSFFQRITTLIFYGKFGLTDDIAKHVQTNLPYGLCLTHLTFYFGTYSPDILVNSTILLEGASVGYFEGEFSRA